MQWSDEGLILSTRRHGESSVIVDLMTRHNGRHAGMVRGGRSKRYRPVLQPGNRVAAQWKGRLPEHLGLYILEPLQLRAALVMTDPQKLMALQSVCSLAGLLAEREPHEGLFEATELMIAALAGDDLADDVPSTEALWPPLLVRWELGLLAALGFGLDLETCAATGEKKDLVYVSPRSMRAVSKDAGAPYHKKLLPLPAFLVDKKRRSVSSEEVKSGLYLTGYFLQHYMKEHQGQEFPEVRQRLYASM